MKRVTITIISVVIVAMIGWTIYDFLDVNNVKDKNTGEIDDGVAIETPSNKEDHREEVTGDGEIGLEIGNTPPDFELKTLDGESVRLSDYENEQVIINFWATWCPPCREEIPAFQKLYDTYDVEILAIDLVETEKSLDDVNAFVYDDLEMTFPVLLDETSAVADTYKVYAYPTSYLVDSNGQIQFIAIGAMEYEQMEQQLNNMD